MLYFSFASISFIGPCSLGVAKMVTPTTYGISGMVSMLVSLLVIWVVKYYTCCYCFVAVVVIELEYQVLTCVVVGV